MRDGFQELVMSSIPRSCEQRVKPYFDRGLSSHTRPAGVGVGMGDKQRGWWDDRQRGDGNGDTFPFPSRPPVSFLAPGSSGRHRTQCLDAPVVGVLPGGSATTSSPCVSRPMSCSCVRCVTGIGDCQLAPTNMQLIGVRWCVAVSSVMRAVGRGMSLSNAGSCLSPPAAAAASTLCLRCRLVSALARILRRIEKSALVPTQRPGRATQSAISASTTRIPPLGFSSQPKTCPRRAT